MKKLLRTCFMRLVAPRIIVKFLYILAFGGELEDFCGSQGFVPYMFPMLFPILFSRCSLILSHTSWNACSFRKCSKFGHKFYWHRDISSLKMKQVKKSPFTLFWQIGLKNVA